MIRRLLPLASLAERFFTWLAACFEAAARRSNYCRDCGRNRYYGLPCSAPSCPQTGGPHEWVTVGGRIVCEHCETPHPGSP